MKLKLTTKPAAAPAAPPAASPAPAAEAPTPSSAAPKLKFKSLATPASAEGQGQPAETPKAKRKYTKKPKAADGSAIGSALQSKTLIKKRPRDENGNEIVSPPTKRKPKPTAKSLARDQSDDDMDDDMAALQVLAPPRLPAMRQGSTLKLKMKAPGGAQGQQKASTAVIKIKNAVGKPPPRPPGVGYDSEAEEAEVDPAIESQFVLRMQPGPDCDLLRKAIEEKRVGRPSADGGTSVIFRFFDREGRRAMIRIQKNMYAAVMVDLPCVIESMKSWNKRDWVKTADICQMLLVLGPVETEEEAKKYPLPREVEPHKHLYPHGLTPPMHYVRKRRFRPRQSYHEIEQREAQVNALIEADERARASGGSTEYQIIDESRMESSEESSEEEDAEGEYEDVAPTTEYVLEGQNGQEEMVLDEDELAAMMMEGFEAEDDGGMDALFAGNDTIEVETPATAHDVAMHTIGEKTVDATPETVVSTPNEPTSPDDDDDDDDDDAESAAEEEVDAAAIAAQEGKEQQMVEIRELEAEIAKAQDQHDTTQNVLFKKRQKKKIEQLKTDLDLKKAAIGLGDDDGD